MRVSNEANCSAREKERRKKATSHKREYHAKSHKGRKKKIRKASWKELTRGQEGGEISTTGQGQRETRQAGQVGREAGQLAGRQIDWTRYRSGHVAVAIGQVSSSSATSSGSSSSIVAMTGSVQHHLIRRNGRLLDGRRLCNCSATASPSSSTSSLFFVVF